jgi:regulatory protein
LSKLGFTKKDNYTRCKNSALYSLAMREHSRLEIYNKLNKKEYAEGVDLEALLDELEASNYLNEERFAESFVRYRISKGQGSIKISDELRQRGLNSFLIKKTIQEAEVDWFELAQQQRLKKFGEDKPADFKEKSRQMRFLSARGFSFDAIRHAVDG